MFRWQICGDTQGKTQDGETIKSKAILQQNRRGDSYYHQDLHRVLKNEPSKTILFTILLVINKFKHQNVDVRRVICDSAAMPLKTVFRNRPTNQSGKQQLYLFLAQNKRYEVWYSYLLLVLKLLSKSLPLQYPAINSYWR